MTRASGLRVSGASRPRVVSKPLQGETPATHTVGKTVLLRSLIVAMMVASACAEPLDVSLVSEVTSIKPGTPFYVGLQLQHATGYHTYWKFAGIVGVPTGIEWQLPPGFKAGDIEWPEPQRVLMYQIKAQGYEGDVLLPIKITPPKDLPLGSKVVLQGKASWMCCGRECNPGFKDLSITLPVSEEVTRLDEAQHVKFEQARNTKPKTLAGWKVDAKRKNGVVELKLIALSEEAKAQATVIKDVIFFTDDGLINADKDQAFSKPAPGVLVMTLIVSEYAEKPESKELRGILQSPQSWSKDGTVKSVKIHAKFDE